MLLSTSHSQYPPFPSNLPAAPLVSVSLAKLEANDPSESQAFYNASKDLGFFYLNMEGSTLGATIVEQAEQLHLVQKQFHALPNSEKDDYLIGKIDPFFGYRIFAERKMPDGTVTRNENYNVCLGAHRRPFLLPSPFLPLTKIPHQIRKDDLIGNSPPLPCPPLISQNFPLLASYAHSCRLVINLLVSHLESHLHLPPSTLLNLHRLTSCSGDHIRFNKRFPSAFHEQRARQSEHTDFGSLTILFNWLGGLQIRLPNTDEWVYVRPIPGCPVVNLGDALVKFTAGILRSNVHRVVPAPYPQDGLDRLSLVFFSRPEDDVVLRRLKGGVIDAQPVVEKDEVEMTSEEWIWRRSVGDLKGVYTHHGGLEARKMVKGRA